MGKAHAIPDGVFYFRSMSISKQGTDKTTFTTLLSTASRNMKPN